MLVSHVPRCVWGKMIYYDYIYICIKIEDFVQLVKRG